MHYVYVIVDRQTGRRYVGYTADLKRRLAEHHSERGARYTKTGDWLLAYYEAFASKEDAVSRERRLKHEGRAKYQLFRRIEKSLADRK